MISANDSRIAVQPLLEVKAREVSTGQMPFEIHARLKTESVWQVIAQFRNEEDARAGLWAIVFTSKYSGVQVRETAAGMLLTEWPPELKPLR
jgi:hypothetical protein